MFQPPNYKWTCRKCGHSIPIYKDENIPQLNIVPSKCPKCGGEMGDDPIVHREPHIENPFKKY